MCVHIEKLVDGRLIGRSEYARLLACILFLGGNQREPEKLQLSRTIVPENLSVAEAP